MKSPLGGAADAEHGFAFHVATLVRRLCEACAQGGIEVREQRQLCQQCQYMRFRMLQPG